jgi:DNA-binding transcriptional ArsR family regulator
LVDEVFRALADPSRRALLDRLADTDGLNLGELCEVLPEMTRFGVMKHLRVLEQANLVVSERLGRCKLHYLNPVPIREVHDRWISKYASPFIEALSDLSSAFGDATEQEEVGRGRTPAHVRDVHQGNSG